MTPPPAFRSALPMAAALAGLLVQVGAGAPLAAQHEHGEHATPSPYAALLDRDIKALADDEAAALADGGGVGLALAAELNGWPGPLHVLELSDRLGLDADTRARVSAVREAMLDEARPLGRRLVAAERELDRAFASGSIEPARVTELTLRAAELRGRLRAVHLQAHLATRALLTLAQVEAYRVARGYGDSPGPPPPGFASASDRCGGRRLFGRPGAPAGRSGAVRGLDPTTAAGHAAPTPPRSAPSPGPRPR